MIISGFLNQYLFLIKVNSWQFQFNILYVLKYAHAIIKSDLQSCICLPCILYAKSCIKNNTIIFVYSCLLE